MIRQAGLALAVLALATGARVETAAACGDGGDGGDGGSSGGSSSSSSSGGDGTVAVVYDPPCIDGTTVVGYRTCAPYGGWSLRARMPRLSFEIGPWSSLVDLGDVAVSGSISHDDGATYSYRVVGGDLGERAEVVGLRSRVLHHQGASYVGLEGGGGGVVVRDIDRRQPMAGVDLASRSTAVVSGGVVAGARTFLGRVSVGGEVMGGLRAISVASTSVHGDCVIEDVRWSAAPSVELRAKGDLWLSPWLTAGAYLGHDALGGETSAGLNLGLHVRAFDGR